MAKDNEPIVVMRLRSPPANGTTQRWIVPRMMAYVAKENDDYRLFSWLLDAFGLDIDAWPTWALVRYEVVS